MPERPLAMIGYQHKFIFIHIPKTGGKSVRKALRPFTLSKSQRLNQYLAARLGNKDVYGIDVGGSHGTARTMLDELGPDIWQSFFTFGFVRNPWDIVVSEFYFTRKRPKSKYYDLVTHGSLEGFVELRHAEGDRQQVTYLMDESGNQLVDFVGKVENYPADFATVCANLGVKATLPHKNRTRHSDAHLELTPKARKLIGELYADDNAAFNYMPA